MKLSRENYYYVYSYHFANRLMIMGYMCKGTGWNPNSKAIFWAFDYKEIQGYLSDLAFKKEHMKELKEEWAGDNEFLKSILY